jgi:hypothetical protein
MRKAALPRRPTRPTREEDLDVFFADDFEDEDVEPALADLRPLCEELRTIDETHRKRSLEYYRELGGVVAEHYERVREEREKLRYSMYGSRFFRRLGRDLGFPWNYLYDSYRLVTTYNEREFKAICKQPAITATHALQLAGIGDKADRKELQQKVVEEGLSVRELQNAFREKYGLRRQPGAGRPVMVPKNVKAAVTHMLSQAEKFDKLHREAWFCDAFDLREEIAGTPADKLSDELRESVSQTTEVFDQLAETTVQSARVLREILADVQNRMQAQAELEQQWKEEGELCPVG